jgi:hypothetical protein
MKRTWELEWSVTPAPLGTGSVWQLRLFDEAHAIRYYASGRARSERAAMRRVRRERRRALRGRP